MIAADGPYTKEAKMAQLELKCKCGQVRGLVQQLKPNQGTHLCCYCKDCQAFAAQLQAETATLNEFGGTALFQIYPAAVQIIQGQEHLACLRLHKKGLYRWYTSCCDTPVANTVGLNVPFVGLIHSFIAPDQDIQEIIGPLYGSAYQQQATSHLPESLWGNKSRARIIFRIISKMLLWKLMRRGKPNPFFNANGQARVKPKIISDGH